MKVAELLEQFQDDPLVPNAPVGTLSDDRREWMLGKIQALRARDLSIFHKLADLMDDNPDDILIQSFPSASDNDPDGHYMNVPPQVKAEPDAFVPIESQGAWYDEDLCTRPHRDEDEWDDVYEIYFVRKTKPNFVNYVKSIITAHQRIEVQLRNSWRWT